jgi:hypothetical protein
LFFQAWSAGFSWVKSIPVLEVLGNPGWHGKSMRDEQKGSGDDPSWALLVGLFERIKRVRL